QVYGRSSITFDEIVRYDIRYVMNQCFKLDVEIFWLTFRSVVAGHGAG
ncbi:MAG: sugar transferase, partial [Anaerolineales bacterium]|nr:sugar transferase [Anaerolineales bacterium]